MNVAHLHQRRKAKQLNCQSGRNCAWRPVDSTSVKCRYADALRMFFLSDESAVELIQLLTQRRAEMSMTPVAAPCERIKVDSAPTSVMTKETDRLNQKVQVVLSAMTDRTTLYRPNRPK